MQVYANLQPLNVCLTYQGTANIVKKISQDYDAEVREWAKNLESNMEKPFRDKTPFLNFKLRSHDQNLNPQLNMLY